MTAFVHRTQGSIASLVVTAFPAAVVTAGLVLLMYNLIANDMLPPQEVPRRAIEFIGVPPDMDPLEPTVRPPEPMEVVRPPEWQEPQASYTPEDNDGPWIEASLPPVDDERPDITSGHMIVAYLKPQPIYPSRALTRNIEGHVDLVFDITAAGSTTNIRVIDAEPEGVFERAAIAALKKWKYKVPIVDDTPQGQVNMMTRLTFEIED